MSKWTPGPWSLHPKAYLAVFSGGRLIANCGGHRTNVNDDAVQAENKANADLIAVAPELYEALMAVRYLFGVLASKDDPVAAHAMKMADAALAQAEGREP